VLQLQNANPSNSNKCVVSCNVICSPTNINLFTITQISSLVTGLCRNNLANSFSKGLLERHITADTGPQPGTPACPDGRTQTAVPWPLTIISGGLFFTAQQDNGCQFTTFRVQNNTATSVFIDQQDQFQIIQDHGTIQRSRPLIAFARARQDDLNDETQDDAVTVDNDTAPHASRSSH
jgi:hypothetical protein